VDSTGDTAVENALVTGDLFCGSGIAQAREVLEYECVELASFVLVQIFGLRAVDYAEEVFDLLWCEKFTVDGGGFFKVQCLGSVGGNVD